MSNEHLWIFCSCVHTDAEKEKYCCSGAERINQGKYLWLYICKLIAWFRKISMKNLNISKNCLFSFSISSSEIKNMDVFSNCYNCSCSSSIMQLLSFHFLNCNNAENRFVVAEYTELDWQFSSQKQQAVRKVFTPQIVICIDKTQVFCIQTFNYYFSNSFVSLIHSEVFR